MTDGHGHVGIGSNFIFLPLPSCTFISRCAKCGVDLTEKLKEKLQDAEQAVDSRTPLYLTSIGLVSY